MYNRTKLIKNALYKQTKTFKNTLYKRTMATRRFQIQAKILYNFAIKSFQNLTVVLQYGSKLVGKVSTENIKQRVKNKVAKNKEED